MRLLLLAVAAVTFFGCPDGSGADGGKGGGAGGGGGGSNEAFTLTTLDADARETTYLAMAHQPGTKRIGVAYFTPRGTMINPGVPDYDLKYLEWNDGVLTPPVTIRFMQRLVGLSLTFQPGSGEPALAFLGGDDTFVPGMSIFWFQSDAVVATRSGGVWTQNVVARNSNEAFCGNPVSDNGFLVGLWPSIVFDGAGQMVFAWRDGHNTTFMAWQGSDVESAEGPLANPVLKCVNPGGNGGLGGKPAWGGRIQLVVGAGGQPAMVYDRVDTGADDTGYDVWFQRRLGGNWSAPQQLSDSTNTQTGASLAYDSTAGYGLAVYDGASRTLRFRLSPDGVTWDAADEVFGAGSGGWYPSLAFDDAHDPNIAYYVCSPADGVAPGDCPAASDELVVARRSGGGWNALRVDAAGGYAPKLGVFADGKRFVVYRDPRSGVVKLATER